MKKIYFCIALTTGLFLSGRAQNDRNANLSEDVKAAIGIVSNPVDLSTVQQQQKGALPPVIAGCDTLGTTFAAGNGQSGNMFDVTNSSSVAIQITGVRQCFQATSTTTVEIYYKTGTFAGFEANPAAWTLAGSASVTPAAMNTPAVVPVTLTLSIPAGATYGLYVTNNSTSISVAYTNGNNQGGVYSQKNGLQIKEGRGIAYPFGSAFGTSPASRIWNGVIDYCSPLIMGLPSYMTYNATSDIYPNPMANEANVKISSSVNVANATLKIYDMSGRLVHSMNNINENNLTLTHNLNSGLYIVQVENNNLIVLNKKISVQ